MSNWIIGYVIWIAIASLVSYGFFAVDKWRAVRGLSQKRIPERTLHIIDSLGGWPGGWLATYLLRHKTQKVSFRIVFWITVLLNLALTAGLGWGVQSLLDR